MSTSLRRLPERMESLRELRLSTGSNAPIGVTVQAQVPTRDELDQYEEIGVSRVIVYPFDLPRDPRRSLTEYAQSVRMNAVNGG